MIRFRFTLVVLAALLSLDTRAADPVPVVAIDSGRIAGLASGDTLIYRGVPYAAPPTGELRWRTPQPVKPWSGIRSAAEFGPACPQASPGDKSDIAKYGGAPEPTSEDCLTLNVWAPAHVGKHAPVMVWFHGGAGRIGAGSLPMYDGASFARDGVVLVTINYRIGNLGSFAYPGLAEEAAAHHELVGAYGMMDQIAALKWVKRNIAAFGGDPGNVTIFGESSGGISVFTMLVSPISWGLFEKAIVESGGGWFGPTGSRDDAEKKTKAAMAAAGAPPNATLQQLRALPARQIAGISVSTAPEPDPQLVPGSMTVDIAAGRVAPVPLMIGVTDGEDSLIDRAIFKAAGSIDDDTLSKMRALYGANIDREMAARLQFRDGVGTAPARWVSARWPQPAYLYRFEHVTASYRPERKRASHGAEIFYVFQTLGREPDVASHPSPNDEALAAQIHARWVAFAKTGSPDPQGMPRWPAYAHQSDRWMVFGQDRSAVQAHVLKPQLDYFEDKTGWLIFFFRVMDSVSRFFAWL